MSVEAQLGESDLPELYRSGRAKAARSKRNRIITYVISAVIVAVVVAYGDWAKIADKYLDVERAGELFPEIITIATKNTLIYTVGAFVGGVTIGLVMAIMRLSSLGPYGWFAITYLDRVCISVAGPRMQEDLGIDPGGLGLATGMFTLAYCLLEIPTGTLGDRLCPRRVLTRTVLW